MKTSHFTITIVLFFLFTCQSNNDVKSYLRWVGDIEYDDQKDDPNFNVCNGENNVLQYFNLEKGPVYFGEKTEINNTYMSQFKPIEDKTQNGLIRIRFVINCEGKASRFRVLQSNDNYHQIEFDKRIISQLLDITKTIEQWEVLYREENPMDYYMYLIFKITDGQLTEILP
jgi:hypothetical protein